MNQSLPRRGFLVLISLGIMVGPSAASATSLNWVSLVTDGRTAWHWIGDFLAIQQRAEGASTARHRCGIDPNGQPSCQEPTPAPTGRAGCPIDGDEGPRCSP